MALVVATSNAALASVLPAAASAFLAAEFRTPTTMAAAPAGLPANAPASDARHTASVPTSGGVPIVEAHVHVDTRNITMTSNVLTDHILFFGNGLVAREGVITGPRECYALYDAGNLKQLPRNYGRWQADKGAGTVRIQWQEGPPWLLRRDGNRLSVDGKMLLPLRPFEGLRMNGVYVHRDGGGPIAHLALGADGRFEAAGLIESMTCWRQLRPGAYAGSGHYEVRQWTLLLRFANGAVTALPMHLESGENLQQVGKFLLNGRDFDRVR
ncbi:MAG: hypothetical protein ACKVQU_01000 [Burkholderiales bacterium]